MNFKWNQQFIKTCDGQRLNIINIQAPFINLYGKHIHTLIKILHKTHDLVICKIANTIHNEAYDKIFFLSNSKGRIQ